MCKKLCFLICFAVMVSLIVSDFARASVSSNGGFENGTWTSEWDLPTDWSRLIKEDGWATWKNNSDAHGGSKFICLGGYDLADAANFNEIVSDIRVGAIYLFEVWVKTENWGSPTVKLKVQFKNSNNAVIGTDQMTLFTGQQSAWQKYTLETNPAPIGATDANIICEANGPGSVWLDDVYVIPAPVTDGPDILTNGGFENGTWTSEDNDPTNWWGWCDANSWAAWKNDANYAHTGSKFIAMGSTDTVRGGGFLQDVYGLEAGERYVFSAWARAENVFWGWPTAKIYIEFKNSSNTVIGSDSLTMFSSRNTDWKWYNLVTDPAPAGTTQANFICFANGTGTIWFDDVKATLYVPEIAKNPAPRSGDVNVDKDVVLGWVPGEDANSHNVYFGTSFNDVNNATTSSSQYKGNQPYYNDTYDSPGDFELGSTYYWRVDEVNSTGIIYKGDVWSFTVTNLQIVEVNSNQTYQEIDGFGGSMTDSSAYLINHMNSDRRLTVMNALFDRNSGIGLSYLRQPMGTPDFRAADPPYTYDDIPAGQTDYSLTNFSVTRDMSYIIPLLLQASTINQDLKIMASPWTPPAWMKTNQNLYGGSLIDSNAIYDTYADYFVKYVQAYEAQGLIIDAVTLQNEPLCVLDYAPTMGMTAAEQIRLIKRVGVKFAAAGISTKIICYDHNWDHPEYPLAVLADPTARSYIAGTSFHGYEGNVSAQKMAHDAYTDKGIYLTELTGALSDTDFDYDLMKIASKLVISPIRNWSRCVIMWNLVLDTNGLPKVGGSTNCRGIITFKQSTGEIIKNPEYYVLGHFSKFVKPGAVRIDSTETTDKITNVAFQNPDGSIVVVMLNENTGSRDFRMKWNSRVFSTTLLGRSITTFTWANQADPNVGVWITSASGMRLTQLHNTKFSPVGTGLTYDGMYQSSTNIDGAYHGIEISPDGKHAYATAYNSEAVAWFTRNISTGALTYGGKYSNSLYGAIDVSISPDGEHVYVVSYDMNRITWFTRDTSTGALTYGSEYNSSANIQHPLAVRASPDGKHVYVAAVYSNSVAWFTRNATTGALTYGGNYSNANIYHADTVALSPNGQNAYVSSDNGVAWFTRNTTTGALTYVDQYYDVNNLPGADFVTVSPDGKNAYVINHLNTIVWFTRNTSTGALTYTNKYVSFANIPTTIEAVVSPDGRYVYVSFEGSEQVAGGVAWFRRNAATGDLIFGGVCSNSDTDMAIGVAVSPNGANVYSTSLLADAVAYFTFTKDKYTEKFQDITIGTANAWTDVDLSSYGVDANQVVEIGIRNSSTSAARSAGVRIKGSSVNRRVTLHYASTAGWDMTTMTVKTDANKKIQAYAANTTDVHFYLLGTWNTGNYTEKYQALTISTTGSWVDSAALSAYGVGANQMVEVMAMNTSTSTGYIAGIRAKGSALDRKLTLHKSTSSASDCLVMQVKADANKKIQVYKGNTAVSFVLLGYWTTAPGTFNEKFVSVGKPASSATWTNRDLSGNGVTANAICEMLIANGSTTNHNNVGVREIGFSPSRLFDIHKSSASTARECGMMHVEASANSTIQQYLQNSGDTVEFYLLGYWN